MGKLTIVVHGGAGPDSDFIKQNKEGYLNGLKDAADAGYKILEEGGTAIDAVEAAVNSLEDNYLFNAGRGSALNEKGEVEMDACIMNGETLDSGAVAIVRNVKNPVTLARAVMEQSKQTYLGGEGALEYARQLNFKLMPDAYFITDHSYNEYAKALQEEDNTLEEAGKYQVKRRHGTVGAVAVDKQGNVAAATSTGGLENCMHGRIADSSMTGVGTYANNKTCAVSATGDGEELMRNVIGFHTSALMQYNGLSVKDACDTLMNKELKDAKGDMGIIAVDAAGNFSMEFNSQRMHRAWRTSEGENGAEVY